MHCSYPSLVPHLELYFLLRRYVCRTIPPQDISLAIRKSRSQVRLAKPRPVFLFCPPVLLRLFPPPYPSCLQQEDESTTSLSHLSNQSAKKASIAIPSCGTPATPKTVTMNVNQSSAVSEEHRLQASDYLAPYIEVNVSGTWLCTPTSNCPV